jgi:hypothetical protein
MSNHFREIPSPTYDYEVSILVNYYQQAIRDLRSELNRIDLTNYQRANVQATLREVNKILKELDKNAVSWTERYIPQAVNDGIARALIALGVATSFKEADKIMKMNRLNQNLVTTAVADTQSDLLQISQNVSRKVRTTVRQVTAEVMRSNLTKGINGRKALTSEIVSNLREQLGDSLNTGIVDASGRRWEPRVYAETVVRTKMSRTHTEATQNEAVQRGALYGVISRHGATDACRFWEGKIVKLSRDAEGNYPYIGDLPRREIFHPRCRHLISPIKRLDRLPDDIQRINEEV